MADADRCVCCGEIIPEGQMVCDSCMRPTKENIVNCVFCDHNICIHLSNHSKYNQQIKNK